MDGNHLSLWHIIEQSWSPLHYSQLDVETYFIALALAGNSNWTGHGQRPLYKYYPAYELSALHPLRHLPAMRSISSVGGVLLAIAASLIFVQRRRRGAKPPYPPGPKGYPVIGNVLDIPQDVPLWKALMSMVEKYSEWFVLAAHVCGLTLVYADSDVLYLNLLALIFSY